MTTNKTNVMAEDGGDETLPSDGHKPEEQQTVEIPLSACPTPPKPGQTLHFKVVSIDQNGGVINAVCTDYGPEKGGSDSLAAEFNEPRSQSMKNSYA